MNATIRDALLIDKLKLLSTIVPRQAPQPLFQCILLEPFEEYVRLTAGDMVHFVQTHTLSIEGLDRPLAAQADLLQRTLAMIDGDYRLRIEQERLVIETDSGRFASITFDGENYLEYLPRGNFELLFEMEGEEVHWLLQGLEHILEEKGYREAYRYAVLQPGEGGYVAYATQGNMILAKRLRVRTSNPLRFALPVDIVKLLRSAIEKDRPVRFGRIGGHLVCETDTYRFFYRDVTLQDLPFEQVLNATNVIATALAKVDTLAASLKRLARFNEKGAVDLELSPEHLTIRTADDSGEEACETLSDVESTGSAIIRVNARFLQTLLAAAASSHVELRFGQPTQPLLLTADEGRTRAALAPMFKD